MGVAADVAQLLPQLENLAGSSEDIVDNVDEDTRERFYSVARKLMLKSEIDSEMMQRVDLGVSSSQ